MKLTKRDLWLMTRAFDAGNIYDDMDAWLADDAADGVIVADVLAKDAPRDDTIAAAVAAEREACAAVCDEHTRCFYLSVWDDCAKSCAEEIRARLSP